ncbi:polysaccharide deacetylase family protein [Gammaproteobacteria bacterium]|nr:polysaccharide deacetylase family protein [Gammaproteobacteria bacterium]
MNMAVLLLGYDVECIWKFGVTRRFLRKLREIHGDLQAPCSIFITGQTLKKNKKICRELRHCALFDFQQHTYSHVPFKRVVTEKWGEAIVLQAASIQKIKREVSRTSHLLKRILDVDCIGLTTPYAYYAGLKDQPDILHVLHNEGIRFTRSYGRNKQGGQPVSMQVQPFWYRMQEGREILEFPIQGWQDCIWRDTYGWEHTQLYLQYLKSNIDLISETNLTWCCLHHDWSSVRNDPNMIIMRALITYAKDRGVKLVTYKDYYETEYAKKSGKINRPTALL